MPAPLEAGSGEAEAGAVPVSGSIRQGVRQWLT